MIKLSVVVITLNEAANIGRCLDSVQGIADEIVVVDSYSTDDTVALAEARGARVLLHRFESYNQQREHAALAASFDYILALDADEHLSAELRESIAAAKQSWPADAYTFNRLNRIGDTWLRYTSYYPDRKLRLFDRRKVIFTGIGGHDTVVPIDGATQSHLRGDLLHHVNADLDGRTEQVNRLSTATARYYFRQGRKGSWLRIIFKPFFRFLIEYFVRRGFLGGFYGFAVAITAAHYVFLREAKLVEMGRLKVKG
jgi:glycosyltransferase involved in cell wall biosynthesis